MTTIRKRSGRGAWAVALGALSLAVWHAGFRVEAQENAPLGRPPEATDDVPSRTPVRGMMRGADTKRRGAGAVKAAKAKPLSMVPLPNVMGGGGRPPAPLPPMAPGGAGPGAAGGVGPGLVGGAAGGAAGQGPSPGPGGGPQGKGGAAGWDGVGVPDEMAVGIEYKAPKRGTRFSFNLVDADLIELIKIIGNITGKSFIMGGKVPNIKATIYAPTKITADEAYQAFLSVLQVNGLTVMPAGRYLKVLQLGGSTAQNTPILARNVPPGDQIVTRLQPLEHVAAEDLAQLLDRFKSPEGDLTVYAPTNTIIITDYGTSIQRLLKLIGLLDVPGTGEQIWIEPVNYASASELADRISEIFDISGGGAKRPEAPKSAKRSKAGREAGGSQAAAVVGEQDTETKISKILADERTNSLIIVASESAYLRILELVKQLDIPIAGEGTIHVHRLQHADATELSKTLSSLSRGSRGTQQGKGKTGGTAVAPPGPGGEGSSALFEGEMQISADKATNSLVIVSSLRDYVSLKEVIDALDTMQRQVFVEAVIMEVSLDKNRDLGLGFHAGNTFDTGDGQALVYGSSQPNDKLNSLLLGPGAMSGLAAGVRGPDLPGTEDLLGTGVSIPAFGVALQALQTNSDVNVLSTPHILATDAVEAQITVGENVPVQQGYNPAGSLLGLASAAGKSSSSASGLSALGALGGYGGLGGFSISRQNVGLTLKITPHINDDNQVRLEMDLEISEVKSIDSNMGPNISKQNAVTTSVVRDQQTIVIGGLITDNQVETTQKVPVLGDIPILGFFFRHKSSLTKKRNLLIFMTPYIIRTADDFREIFSRKMAERREFIERYTAFEYHRIDPHLDWSRTNGAVAEMNLIIKTAEDSERLKTLSNLSTATEHTPKQPIKFANVAKSGAETPPAGERADVTPTEPPPPPPPPPIEEETPR
ncbi:MAG: type II secretion system secretin GspD [Deltaproteobacteria bacterium]|nr:type II secretion system secretin GspD [Deltaproteobacteria bacterium]